MSNVIGKYEHMICDYWRYYCLQRFWF